MNHAVHLPAARLGHRCCRSCCPSCGRRARCSCRLPAAAWPRLLLRLLLLAARLDPLSFGLLHLLLLAQQLCLLLGSLSSDQQPLRIQLCSSANHSSPAWPLCRACRLLIPAGRRLMAATLLLPLLRSVPIGRLLLPRRRAGLLGGIQRGASQREGRVSSAAEAWGRRSGGDCRSCRCIVGNELPAGVVVAAPLLQRGVAVQACARVQ